MSKSKSGKKKGGKSEKESKPATLPAAGLLTFYEEDIGGIKVRPEVVVAGTFLLALIVIMAHLRVFGP
ncbi:preprotein translocase subunit Sec61beta [Infirmifilum lucidum]|uniref:Preprotein translocase subunit Sec61beta n=1 Tax=Infirmifilum lucidum TaxID=2776706 RepID=A0A7L9FIH6_9CREN|nr:preprotein translocase subunit Sec61beta [Infirmifilum lucidum]QOJ79638.1 preprotein translocase subunit Sec61beta [Infirmifilum lucidum]